MSKTIFIGGRLESKEKGNVVAGANAILDDTKGKKQNVINKETDDELLRLEQSKQDNLTFDNAPTEDSTNPVTSGGVYTAEKALSDAIEAILLLIPSAATALNKLVDINTMNSSISTATATFRGTYNAVSDLGLTYQATHAQIEAALDALGLTADNNDYAFVQVPVSDQSQDIAKTERYKNNGTNWQYEYDLNTSGFTAAQWAAINSGITVALVTKLTDLPTAAALQLALNAKQDTLTFDTEPTALSQNPVTSGGIYTALQAIVTALGGRLDTLEGLIPTEATSSNKLTDKAYVDGLIQAITELIPAEATTSNQLADKAYVLASILAATPAFKGQFVTLAELQAVASPKAGDLGIVRTKDSDGMDVFTVYQYLNNAWGVFYSLSYHPQTKPATTGSTGDYPYNGMGRVELAKNMVNTGTELAPVMVNQLTQDMFYKGAVGSRVPNTNTIFVIHYDYVLAENITIPDGCVLQFDGGSISGAYTVTGANTQIIATCAPIFNELTIAGTWLCSEIFSTWFADIHEYNRIQALISLCNNNIHNDVYIEKTTNNYKVEIIADNTITGTGILLSQLKDITIYLDGVVELKPNNLPDYHMFKIYASYDITFKGVGTIIGDRILHDYSTHQDDAYRTHEWGRGFCVKDSGNITINGITSKDFTGDSFDLVYDGLGDDISIDTTGIQLLNITCENSRRQGVSATNVRNLHINGLRALNIGKTLDGIDGTAPGAAVDLEPNSGFASNIIIENLIAKDCFGGIMSFNNPVSDICNLSIRNINVINSATSGVYINGLKNFSASGIKVSNSRFGFQMFNACGEISDAVVTGTTESFCKIYQESHVSFSNIVSNCSTLFSLGTDGDAVVNTQISFSNSQFTGVYSVNGSSNASLTFEDCEISELNENVGLTFLNSSFYDSVLNCCLSDNGYCNYTNSKIKYIRTIDHSKLQNCQIDSLYGNMTFNVFSDCVFNDYYITSYAVDFATLEDSRFENCIFNSTKAVRAIRVSNSSARNLFKNIKIVCDTAISLFPTNGMDLFVDSNKIDNLYLARTIGTIIEQIIIYPKNVISGTSRPNYTNMGNIMFFDNSLNPARPIWHVGNGVWVDATGATV